MSESDSRLPEHDPSPPTVMADRCEKELCESWSLGRLRPWLQLVAEREMPSVLRGKLEASDVVQQTLLKAWQAQAGFQGQTHAQRLAWLRAILKNSIRDQHRGLNQTQKRGRGGEQKLSELSPSGELKIDALAISPDPTVSAAMMAAEETLALAESIEQLPEDQRRVVMLRHVDELPHAEIAKRMNRSVAAVRMLWVRALKRLGEEHASQSNAG